MNRVSVTVPVTVQHEKRTEVGPPCSNNLMYRKNKNPFHNEKWTDEHMTGLKGMGFTGVKAAGGVNRGKRSF